MWKPSFNIAIDKTLLYSIYMQDYNNTVFLWVRVFTHGTNHVGCEILSFINEKGNHLSIILWRVNTSFNKKKKVETVSVYMYTNFGENGNCFSN